MLCGCIGTASFEEGEPFLSVDKSELIVESGEIQINVSIISNRSWSIEESPCDWIVIDKNEYPNLSGMTETIPVKVTISENKEREDRKTELIIMSGEDEGTRINILQKGYAGISVEVPENPSRIVNPSVFSSLGGIRKFNVKSNTGWTAKVSEESTASGISLSTVSGSGDMSDITVTVSGVNTDMDETKSVIIEFYPEGGSPYRYEMMQQKGSIIAIEARDMDNELSLWPFDENEVESGGSEGILHVGGYGFPYLCTDCSCTHSNGGWQFGSNGHDYIEFPVIDGRRLSRVTLWEYNGSARPYITKASEPEPSPENAVEGGETLKLAKKEKSEFILTDTEADTAYRMYIGNDKTFRFWLVEIEYTR